jgi:hypothetical protein
MLSLLPVLPGEVHHELSGFLILAGVEVRNMVLPASRRWFPRHRFRGEWRVAVIWMIAVPL